MIKEALEYLKKSFYNPPDVVDVNGRKYLRTKDGHFQEIRPDIPQLQAFHNDAGHSLSFGTIAALSDFINQHTDKSCQVIVAPRGATAYFDLEKEYAIADFIERCISVSVPFLNDYDKFHFNYVQLMDWLDQHASDIKEADSIYAAVRSLRLVDQNTVKVSEKGPVISIETSASKDLEGGVVSLPKEITVVLPLGTREFRVPCVFLLRVLTNNGMTFILTRKENDGAWDLMLDQALGYLKANNPKVFVTEGK